jgi:predicted ABC-type ATPase
MQERIIIIAGPHRADKTSFARSYLPEENGVVRFLNADLIAAGLSPFSPESMALRAGGIM